MKIKLHRSFLFSEFNSIEFKRYALPFKVISQALVARTTPLFLTFCLQIYFQENFFISLLFHLFFLILTYSCQYSYNLMLTSNCMCRPYQILILHKACNSAGLKIVPLFASSTFIAPYLTLQSQEILNKPIFCARYSEKCRKILKIT